LDEDAVRLISLTLAWMLSSSNRYLRDRVTKACANLLAGRELAAAEIVRRFAQVDDLYIKERVLAVAYGVAMRSRDAGQVKELADAVIGAVFDEVPATPHLLLRDYARGVVERAHILNPLPFEIMQRVRPPYGAKWPRIPAEKSIKKLLESLDADRENAHGARRISFSVLHDDFGRYVIGTNSWSTDWLSLRLDQPAWRPYRALLKDFEDDLDAALRPLWNAHSDAESVLERVTAFRSFAALRLSFTGDDEVGAEDTDLDLGISVAKKAVATARGALLHNLRPEQSERLQDLWRLGRAAGDRPPKFDLRLMQRYILKRVFSLGWSSSRFEYFDTHVIQYTGREAAKAERVGKKYQWIAYHEICALVADNFQFRGERRISDYEVSYDGPWQDFFRDIDPSHAISRTGVKSEGAATWWAPSFEVDWGDEVNGKTWAEGTSDFPSPPELLEIKDNEGQFWIVADLSFDRTRPVPDGMERDELESRRMWCQLTGILVRSDDVGAFMHWAEGVDFWGQWMPRPPSSHGMFLGEYVWSPAWKHFNHEYYGHEGWIRPDKGCPVNIRPAAFEYQQGSQGFDCSVESGFTLHLPDQELVSALSISWSGQGADFRDANGVLATTDPSAHADGPACLLLRRDILDRMIAERGLTICWMLLGEKLAYMPGPMHREGAMHVSGACAFREGRIQGFMHFIRDGKEDFAQSIIATKRF